MEPLKKLFIKQQDQKYETYRKVSSGVGAGVSLKHVELSVVGLLPGPKARQRLVDVLSLNSIRW